jgi:Kef-type K+ transport system membrane component KefB
MGIKQRALLALVLILIPTSSYASEATEHIDPVAPVLLALILILGGAKLGAEFFERLKMPAVLGELVAGIVLGNLFLLVPAWTFFEPLRASPPETDWAIVVDALSRIGVILLLFEVGLESTVQQMLKVGWSSLAVASLGIAAPFALGYGVSRLSIHRLPSELLASSPGLSLEYVHLFIGAVLCATSVGITARVFKDLGKLHLKEARIILGAAVIDDVMGLILLAVISSIVAAAETGTAMQVGTIIRLIAVALVFLGGSIVLGIRVIPRIMRQLSRFRTRGVMLTSSLLLAFALSWAANAVGLAAIVGAFAAGLLLDNIHFRGFRDEIHIEELLRPISTFLVPIFFVLMGIQVRLASFAHRDVLLLAGGLIAAAVVGKQVCGLGVFEKGVDRFTVGIGMIPRGEVGLIFAGMGRTLKVIDDATFSAVVIMVIVTTLLTPPILNWHLLRRQK